MTMSSEMWQRLRAAMDDLHRLPAEELVSALERLERSDPEVAARARALYSPGAQTSRPQSTPSDGPPGPDAGMSGLLQWLGLTADGHPPPPEDTSPAPANRIGRYEILGEIARGGMGAVHRALDPSFGRDLAIKVMLEKYLNHTHMRRRFHAEARMMGQLQHPGIPPVHEAGEYAGLPYFSMKLIEGDTFADLLARRRSPAEGLPYFLGIFQQVCQTVGYAHSRGVIHRDLKPANIMVGAFGEVQVMDWGLAKRLPPARPSAAPPEGGAGAGPPPAVDGPGHQNLTGAEAELGQTTPALEGDQTGTQAGVALGTPAYMPPEQAQGRIDELDERCDVFALGGVLCVVLTGAPPYTGHSPREALDRACNADLGDAHRRLDECQAGPELTALARRCLGPRDGRPRHAGEVADAVAAYLQGVQEKLRQAELERAQAAVQAQEERKRREVEQARADEARHRQAWMFAAVLALLGLAGGVACSVWLNQAYRAEAAARDNAEEAHEAELKQRKLAERARAAADKARREEATHREKAEMASAAATLARRKEEAQRKKAEDAGKAEAEQRGRAEAALAQLERTEHVHSMFLAGQAVQQANVPRARELLASTKPALRDWAWRYLSAQCRAELYSCPGRLTAFSHDGKTLAAWDNGAIRLLDAWSGEERVSIKEKFLLGAPVFAPGGKWLAAEASDGAVHVYEAATGKETAALKAGVPIGGPVFSPDGALVLTGIGLTTRDRRILRQGDGVVRAFDPRSGKELFTLKGPGRFGLSGPLFSPDGKTILALGDTGKAHLFEVKSRKERASFQAQGGPLSFSHDGKRLAGRGHDGTFRVYDAQAGKELHSFRGRASSPFAPAPEFSPDGKYLLSLDGDRAVRLYDAQTGKEALALKGPKAFGIPAFSPDGMLIAVGPATHAGDGAVRVYDARSGEQQMVLQAQATLGTPAFSPDATRLVVAPGSQGGDGRVRVYDVRAGKITAVIRGAAGDQELSAPIDYGHRSFTLRLPSSASARPAFSRDGKRFAVLGGDKVIRVFDTLTGREQAALKAPGGLGLVRFSPDGKSLAAGPAREGDGVVRLFDATSGKELLALKGPDALGAPVFSPDGKHVGATGKDRAVHVFTVASGKLAFSLKAPKGLFTPPAFSSDGKLIAAMEPGGAIHLFDASDGRPKRAIPRVREKGERPAFDLMRVFNLDLEAEFTSAPFFGPDGRVVADVGADGVVHMYEAGTGRQLYALKGPSGNSAAVFNPDGSTLACIGKDGALRVYEAATGRERFAVRGPAAIRTAEFTPDGKAVFVGVNPQFAGDARARLYDASNGREMLALDAPIFRLRPVFSPDGRCLAVVSSGIGMDNLLTVWEAPDGLERHQRAKQARAQHGAAAWHRHRAEQLWGDRHPFGFAFHARRLCALEPNNGANQLLLARALSQAGDRAGAKEAFKKALPFEASLSAPDRAEAHAELEQWAESARLIEKLAEAKGASAQRWHQLALLRLQQGDRAGYTKACEALSSRFARAGGPHAANSVAWACALAPRALPDLAPTVALSRAVVRANPTSHSFRNTLGALLYRAGEHADAVKELQQSVKLAADGGHALDFLFLAMAHHQLEKPDEAAAYLEKARLKAAKSPPSSWADRLEWSLILREAEELLRPK